MTSKELPQIKFNHGRWACGYRFNSAQLKSGGQMLAAGLSCRASALPCIHAKLCQLRSASTHPRDFKSAIHEVALLVAAEAYAKVFRSAQDGVVGSPMAARRYEAC